MARLCAALFPRCFVSVNLNSAVKEELLNEQGRLKIWAGNIGIFATGTASTDYRLRDDPEIKEVMVSMLDRLRSTLQRILELPKVDESTEDEEGDEIDVGGSEESTSSSEASLVLDIDEGDNGSIETPQISGHASIQDSIETCKTTITNLYRLSAAIKKPVSYSENAKVTRFMHKEQEKAEEAGGEDEFLSHVKWLFSFRYKQVSPKITDRLINAIVFRRKRLEYRKRHQEKLQHGVEDVFDSQSDEAVQFSNETIQQKNIIQQHISRTRRVNSLTKGETSQLKLDTFSATDASSVNHLKVSPYPKSIALSGVTRSGIARREQLDVPHFSIRTQGKEVICPYCFRVIDTADVQGHRWTRHLLRDLEPYVCLFEDCVNSGHQYRTVEEWVSHMQWQHTLTWFCPISQHREQLFYSKDDLASHIQSEHAGSFTRSQLDVLTQKNACPASSLFEILAGQSTATFETPSDRPLCLFSALDEIAALERKSLNAPLESLALPKTEISRENIIKNHIALHLEEFALLSLLEKEYSDEDDASIGLQQSENYGTGRDKEDLPSLMFSSSSDEESDDEFTTDQNVDLLSHEHDNYRYLDPDEANAIDQTWRLVTEHRQLYSDQPALIDISQDPTLQTFLQRARLKQSRAAIPMIVIYDENGIQTYEDTGEDISKMPESSSVFVDDDNIFEVTI